ncbi:MAG: right-handed parallel beta-helix repeat-containing protein [Anaerolineales bacterium]|nr:right-handed parallel beta-helix repeat-containing protein [Anaerolineales bacterium]
MNVLNKIIQKKKQINWILLYTLVPIVLIGLTVFLAQKPRVYYLSPTGSNAGACKKFSPCKSFSKVISLVKPGEIIHFTEGVYSEPVFIDKSGTEDQPITILGDNAILQSMVIAGNYVTVSGIEVFASESHGIKALGHYIIIENSKVHHSVTENGYGPECNTENSSNGWGSGIKVERGAKHIIIRNNEVYENCGEGIAATMGEFVTIVNNISRDNYSVNIYIDNSSQIIVDGNQVLCTGNGYLRDGRRATGIALGEEYYDGWGAQRGDNSIINNIIDGCYEGISSWEPDVEGGVEKNLLIQNNTVINGTYQSISLYWINQDVRVEDNIVYTPLNIEFTEGVTLSNNVIAPGN